MLGFFSRALQWAENVRKKNTVARMGTYNQNETFATDTFEARELARIYRSIIFKKKLASSLFVGRITAFRNIQVTNVDSVWHTVWSLIRVLLGRYFRYRERRRIKRGTDVDVNIERVSRERTTTILSERFYEYFRIILFSSAGSICARNIVVGRFFGFFRSNQGERVIRERERISRTLVFYTV